MTLFTSSREKRLWLYALLALTAIFTTLLIGRPFQQMIYTPAIQLSLFLTGMVLTLATILAHGLKVQPGKAEWAIWLGLAAVYLMFVFRIGAPERSHLMEYGVLAIFIHQAMEERFRHKNKLLLPGLIAFVIACTVGTLDESAQMFLPNRVFDPEDILFNCLAAGMAIGTGMVLQWARRRFRKSQ